LGKKSAVMRCRRVRPFGQAENRHGRLDDAILGSSCPTREGVAALERIGDGLCEVTVIARDRDVAKRDVEEVITIGSCVIHAASSSRARQALNFRRGWW
jgi:hypothetical protein